MITHQARMLGKKANRAALEPGVATVLPAGNAATQFSQVNRKARRAAIAKAQAGKVREDGTVVRRLKTHAAEVRYWRGVQNFGVCTTRLRPIDVRAYAEETDGAVEELCNGEG